MVSENPKVTLLNLLKANVKVNKSDGKPAKVDFCFPFPEEELPKRLATYDAIVTVKMAAETCKPLGIGKTQRQYKGEYAFEVWTKDEKLRFAINEKIKELLKEKGTSPGGVLKLVRKLNQQDDDRVGSSTFLHSIIRVETWHYG